MASLSIWLLKSSLDYIGDETKLYDTIIIAGERRRTTTMKNADSSGPESYVTIDNVACEKLHYCDA